MKINLQTNLCGFPLINPFILASAPPTASFELICNAFEKGWGGAVTKTIGEKDVFNSNVSPRMSVLQNGSNIIALENIEMISDKPEEYWTDSIQEIKKRYPKQMLIASIMGAEGLNSWQSVALKVQKAGADAVELNFSCPNGVTAQGLGLSIGQDNNSIEIITKAVKEVISIPVIVKLTSNVTDISSAAEACLRGGADSICAINTVSVIIGVDIETLTPLPSIDGYSTSGGLSGKSIKPIGLRCIADIAKAVELPIVATGGISNWKDSVEYISLGANALQICTEVMLRGTGIINNLCEGLSKYLLRKGFSSINDFRGAALNKLVAHHKLSRDYRVYAFVDDLKCGLCGTCVERCLDTGNNALSIDNNHLIVNKELCIGCSVCSFVCPKHAISMISNNKLNS